VTVAALLAAAVVITLALLLDSARQPAVLFDEVGAVNLVEVVGGDPDVVSAAVARAGGEIVEVLEPGAASTDRITRARFDEVRDRTEQRAVVTRLEADGLTARPALLNRGW
jgi:hypothetical protein